MHTCTEAASRNIRETPFTVGFWAATGGEGMGPCSVGTFGWLGLFNTEYFVDPAKALVVSFHSQVSHAMT